MGSARLTALDIRESLRTEYVVGAFLAGGAAAMGLLGIGRSLWLDEAWVANSLLSPTLSGMFFYPEWLQTSPPLFLLAARATLALFGSSNAAFRILPFVLAMGGPVLFFLAARKVLRAPFALLAVALLVFDRTALEQAHTLKQYSGEMAVTCALLWAAARFAARPGGREFFVLLLIGTLGLGLAYPGVFLLPGILAVVAANSRRRAILLGLLSGACLGAIAWVFLHPNFSPELFLFWGSQEHNAPDVPWVRMLAVSAIGLAVAVRARGSPMLIVCSLPVPLLVIAWQAGQYPASDRTWLFVRPCVVLVALILAEKVVPLRLQSWMRPGALLAVVLVAVLSIRSEVRDRRWAPVEDAQGAFRYLKGRAGPQDLVLVHASAREQFRLYAATEGWPGPAPRFGGTGWPCCARGKNAVPGSSDERAVTRDVQSLLPAGFMGTVWLLYSTRPTHWAYTGLDEGDLWRKRVWERGCPPGSYKAFENLAVSPMRCGAGIP